MTMTKADLMTGFWHPVNRTEPLQDETKTKIAANNDDDGGGGGGDDDDDDNDGDKAENDDEGKSDHTEIEDKTRQEDASNRRRSERSTTLKVEATSLWPITSADKWSLSKAISGEIQSERVEHYGLSRALSWKL